jgi:hypothetical protein
MLRLFNSAGIMPMHVTDLSVADDNFAILDIMVNGESMDPPFVLRPRSMDVVDILIGVDPFMLRPGTTVDTLVLGSDAANGDAEITITIPAPADTDMDGKIDACESGNPLALLDPNTDLTNILLPDSDGDGLLDGQELLAGCYQTMDTLAGTHPRMTDTDGDGYGDGMEVLHLSTDPLDPADPDPTDPSYADADGDGLPALLDFDDTNPDYDGDGFADGYEYVMGTATTDASDFPPLADVNGDGIVNNVDGIMLFNMILGYEVELDVTVADADRNGYINNIDALVIFYFSLGNVATLPF